MKFTPEVTAALDVLREHAENDFERHRIDVLERDLTNPPTVEIVDEKHQKFNGLIYTKDKTGHYRATFHIQRVAWAYYNGVIPKSYHVHHSDNNPSNNELNNLVCLSQAEHRKAHITKGEPAAHRTWNTEIVCPQCGKSFKNSQSHRIYCSEDCRLKHEFISKICPVCGKIFRVLKKHKHQKFCSRHCFMVDRYSDKG